MKLLALEVENVRRFRGAYRIEGFGPRLNVLCGPNEFGKSTLLQALSAAFFVRHGANSEESRALQTQGSETAPIVRLRFELDGHRWALEKRFLHRPSAQLRGPDERRHDGDAAETRLRELLGFEAARKKPDLGMWDALWVGQGRSFSQAAVEGGLARSTLAECLDAEIGGVAGFGRGDALLREVEAALSVLSDPGGRPKGERRRLRDEHEQSEAQARELEGRRERLTEDIASLGALLRRRDAVRRAISEGRERTEIASVREALARAERFAAEREAAAEALRACEAEHRQARAEVERRDAECGEEETLRAEAAARSACSLAASAASRAADDALRAAREALERAEMASTEAALALEAARRAAGAGEDRARLAAHEGRLARARALDAEIAAARGRIGAMPVDRATMDALQLMAREIETQRDRLQAQATQVEIIGVQGGPSFTLSIGGRTITAPATFAAIEETDLVLEGLGVIRLRPPATGREAARRRLVDAERNLAAKLAAFGMADLETAALSLAERTRASEELERLRQSLARAVAGDEAVGLEPGVAAMAAHVEMLRERVALAGEVPTDEEALAERVERAETARREAADGLQGARARFETSLGLSSERRAEAVAAASEAETALKRAIALETARADDERARPRLLLDAAVGVAAHDEHEATMRLVRLDETEIADPAALRIRITRLEEAMANRDADDGRLGEQIARLRERIDREGGAGVDEQVAAERRNGEMLARRLAVLDREAEALTRLRATLRETVAAVRAATMRPLTDRIAPRLGTLLPGTAVECDEDFRITTLARPSGLPEPFAQLSDGTREQIAVLARLAFAEMLAERGRPAMVILDDALAFSDGTRIEQMFDILTDAAARVQILVLTCREDLFGRLGGTRLTLEAVGP